jgi:uncharacterized protein
MLKLAQPAKPTFRLVYKGIDISDELAPELISCTYTDKVHGEADEIDVTVQDKDGKWRGAWCPEHGDKAELDIGYVGLPLTPCGSFEIDEPKIRMGRSGDTMTFRGVAAAVTKSLRTAKTRGYEKQSLKQIAEKVAKEHGLSIVGTPPEVSFDRVTQRRERDLEFLTRMADAYGAYFTVRDKQMIFAERREVHERKPVFTIRGNSDDYLTADLQRAAHKTYSKAKLAYYDGNEKKKIEAEVEDGKVKTGDTLRIDERVENDGQAKKRATSELEKANLKKQTGNIVLVGNPLLVAGQTVQLDQDFGKWAGTYVIQSSRHHIVRGQSYTTNIEIALVEPKQQAKNNAGGKTGAAAEGKTSAGATPRGAEPRAQGRYPTGGV